MLAGSFNAQIGIKQGNPQSTLDIAVNDINNPSNNSGIIVPRVTSLNTTGTKEKGLLVFYNSAVSKQRGFYWWNGTNWIPFLSINKLSSNKRITYVSAANIFKEGSMNSHGSTSERTLDFETIQSNEPGNFEINSNGQLVIKKKGYYYLQAASFISKAAGNQTRRDQLDMKIYVNDADASANNPENFDIEGSNSFPVKFTTISINAAATVKLDVNDKLSMKIIRTYNDGGTDTNTTIVPDTSARSNITLNFLGDF